MMHFTQFKVESYRTCMLCTASIWTRGASHRHCSVRHDYTCNQYHCHCSFWSNCVRYAAACVRRHDRRTSDSGDCLCRVQDLRKPCSPRCFIASAGNADVAVVCGVGNFPFPIPSCLPISTLLCR